MNENLLNNKQKDKQMATSIYISNGTLKFYGSTLASRSEYELANRCVGSIFEALHPGDRVRLVGGVFMLNQDLDLIPV